MSLISSAHYDDYSLGHHWDSQLITNVISANQHFPSTFSRRSFRLSFLFPLRCQSTPENSLSGYFSTDIDTRFLLGAKCWIRPGGEGTWAVTPNCKVNHSLFLILQKKMVSTDWGNLFFIWCYGSPEERLWPRLHGEKLPWSSSRVALSAELTLVTVGSQQCMRMLWLSHLDRVDPSGWAKVFTWRKVGPPSRVFPLQIS